MVAQAVIEKIALPIDPVFSGDELLPVFDGRLHSRFAREGNNRMQMIRHQQTQAECQTNLSWLNFTAASTALPVSDRHS